MEMLCNIREKELSLNKMGGEWLRPKIYCLWCLRDGFCCGGSLVSVECRGTKAARGHRPWFNLQERWQQREEAFKFAAVLVLEPEPCTRQGSWASAMWEMSVCAFLI